MDERLPRLCSLGLTRERAAQAADTERLGRVVSERRGELLVALERGDVTASVLGRMQRAVDAGEALRPAVGDWVELRTPAAAGDGWVIDKVQPRSSVLARRSTGRVAREQVLAANLDHVLIVCALGRDINERRIERFVAIAENGHVQPVVLLNKSDLLEAAEIAAYVQRVEAVVSGVPVHVISALTAHGLEPLAPYLVPGRTVALLGTSGAGKSSLFNALANVAQREISAIGVAGKGRHTTVSRELLLLPSGAALIDSPGLREVALWSGERGVERAFDDVTTAGKGCRFADCLHDAEPGCAVQTAVANGELERARVDSWRQLRREQAEAKRPRLSHSRGKGRPR